MNKMFALFLAFCMVLGLTTCGNKGESPVVSDSSSGAEETASTVTYYSMWNETEAQAVTIAEAAKAFTAETGINVNIVWNGRDNITIAEAAIQAGTAVDIMDFDLDQGNNVWAEYALNLETLVVQAYDHTNGTTLRDSLMNSYLDLAASLGENGELHCMVLVGLVKSADHIAKAMLIYFSPYILRRISAVPLCTKL